MSSSSEFKFKISEHLKERDKKNFGVCRRCEKKVYWSTCKIASHIRSGHCPAATKEEVNQFKQDFVYETPKNLVHRLNLKVKTEDSPKSIKTDQRTRKSVEVPKKKLKLDELNNSESYEELYEEEEGEEDNEISVVQQEDPEEVDNERDVEYLVLDVHHESSDEYKTEIVTNKAAASIKGPKVLLNSQQIPKEDKFINAVYPQFSGKTKLQLIEELFEIRRKNELLKDKCKTYEETINRLLN